MNMRYWMALAAACLLPAGCRWGPMQMQSYVEELHSQQRMLEDQMNEDWHYYQEQLDKLRNENNALREKLGDEDGDIIPRIEIPDIPSGPANGQNSGEPMLIQPQIDSGEQVDPESVLKPKDDQPAPGKLPAPKKQPGDSGQAAAPRDMRVTHVVLNPYLTGGHDFDGKPGDDGVSIVLQPRNADDLYVPQAGDVSIVVLDPLKEGQDARVARWDLPASDVQARLRGSDRTNHGIHLHLPWPDGPPEHENLRVFLRYQTADDRLFETDGELVVGLPGQFSHRWTPRPPERLATRPRQPVQQGITSPPIEQRLIEQQPIDQRQQLPDNFSPRQQRDPQQQASSSAAQQQRPPRRLSRRDRFWKPYR